MFVHAEEVQPSIPLKNKDLTLFVRMGTDFKDNYYEYELPLNRTEWGATVAEDIWPEANNVEIVFDNLLNLKKKTIKKNSITLMLILNQKKHQLKKMGMNIFMFSSLLLKIQFIPFCEAKL